MFGNKQRENSGEQYALTPLGEHKVDRYFNGSLRYRVMDCLNGERYLTTRELAKKLEVNESAVKEILHQLMDEFKYVILRKRADPRDD